MQLMDPFTLANEAVCDYMREGNPSRVSHRLAVGSSHNESNRCLTAPASNQGHSHVITHGATAYKKSALNADCLHSEAITRKQSLHVCGSDLLRELSATYCFQWDCLQQLIARNPYWGSLI